LQGVENPPAQAERRRDRDRGRRHDRVVQAGQGNLRQRSHARSRRPQDQCALFARAILNLENRWTFEPKGEEACDVGFFIAYEFKSRMLAMLMGTMFDAAFAKFSMAFEKRADVVYGRPRPV
jgi:ribosome-associated toxin RatA of RatAB toxin-antitoxin module